jgi:RHS repeat-associated protein
MKEMKEIEIQKDFSSLASPLSLLNEYSPFGELLRCEGAYAKSNPFRFSTKFTDDESGLVYYGHRFYSAALGRFINRDPKEEAGGINLYGFCRNNPINSWDYLGLLPVFTFGGQSWTNDTDMNALFNSWSSSGQSTPWISINIGSSSGYGLNWNPFGNYSNVVVVAKPINISTGTTNSPQDYIPWSNNIKPPLRCFQWNKLVY